MRYRIMQNVLRSPLGFSGMGTPGLGAATVLPSNFDGAKLEVGNRYRIEFEAKGVQGGGVPWTPSFLREIEAGLAMKGWKVKAVNVNQGTFAPTSGSSVLDKAIDWIPGAGILLPSRDLLGNFTFSIDIDILGRGDPPQYLHPEDMGIGMKGFGAIPVAYAIGIGIVAGVVALSVLAPSIVVRAVTNLGKAAGEGITAALTGLGPVGIGAVALGVFLWMKYSKKGQAAKARYFG